MKKRISYFLLAAAVSMFSFGNLTLALAGSDVSEDPMPTPVKASEAPRLALYGSEIKTVRDTLIRQFGQSYILTVKWGDLKNKIDPLTEVTDWTGSIEVENATISLKAPILFDLGQDSINKEETTTNKIAWTSKINGHYDGVMIKLIKDEETKNEDVKITFRNMTAPNIQTDLEELIIASKETEVNGGYGVFMRIDEPLKLVKKFVNNHPMLIQVRWGDLNFANGDENNAVKYEGSIKANNARLHIVRPLLFEGDDIILTDKGDEVNWESNIQGHWDGILLKVLPATVDVGVDMDATKDRSITITLNDFSKVITDPADLKKYDIGDGYQVDLRSTFNMLHGVNSSVVAQNFEKKLRFMEKSEKIVEQIDKLKRLKKFTDERLKNLVAINEKIAEYNYAGYSEIEMANELDVLKSKLENADLTDFQLNLTLEALERKFDAAKAKAKLQKYKENLIPFKDTDDDEWYTTYVDFVKTRNIVSGYKDDAGNPLGEYKPGNEINVAEMLKIALKSAKYNEENVIGETKNEMARKMWAMKFYKLAEDLGLTVVEDSADDPGRKITRGEVIRLVLEAYGIKPPKVNSTGFSDVDAGDPDADYIEFARGKGIVSGAGDTGTFLPKKQINRAEAEKIMQKAIELFGEE